MSVVDHVGQTIFVAGLIHYSQLSHLVLSFEQK